MTEVRAQHALALKSDLLGHALRGGVVGIGDQVDTLQLEILQRVARKQPDSARANPSAARVPGAIRSSRSSAGCRCAG